MEHRWGQRMAVNVTTRVGSVAHSKHVARLTDISVSGAFLRIGLPVDDLHPLRVEIPPLGGKRARRSLTAYVVRRTEEGVGIEWAEVCAEPVMQLISALRTPEPAASDTLPLAQSG